MSKDMRTSASRSFCLQPTLPLLFLPAELRNEIWEYVLTIPPDVINPACPKTRDRASDSAVTLMGNGSSRSIRHPSTRQASALELLLVCRQILSEAEGLFYSLNNLHYKIRHSVYLHRLGAQIGTSGIHKVRHLERPCPHSQASEPQPSGPRPAKRPKTAANSNKSHTATALYRPRSFLHSLSPVRQSALKAITLETSSAASTLLELEHSLLPLAPNLQTLHFVVTTPRWWNSDLEFDAPICYVARFQNHTAADASLEEAKRESLDWARQVRTLLRGTKVKEVKLLVPSGPFSFATLELPVGVQFENGVVATGLHNYHSSETQRERVRELRKRIGMIERVLNRGLKD